MVEVTLGATAENGGTRSHTITLGGSNALPFHFFEGEHPHSPVVAMEVFDTLAAACVAYNHTLVAQSPIDVNLAK